MRAPEAVAVRLLEGWKAWAKSSSRREIVRALVEERRTGAQLDRIEAACLAYAGDKTAWGASGQPMSPHALIATGRWESFVPAASAAKGSARARTVFACAEIRSAVLAAKGEAWVISWLDPCGWEKGARRVAPGLTTRADKLREVSAIFRTLGVAVEGLGHGR